MLSKVVVIMSFILLQEAVSYLFPSGLFDPRARPMMKPPDEIYPKCKAAEFDIRGRPYHSLFYTSKANYFQFLHVSLLRDFWHKVLQ